MMVRTWLYVISWALFVSLARAFTSDPRPTLLWVLAASALLPWVMDAALARRAMGQSAGP